MPRVAGNLCYDKALQPCRHPGQPQGVNPLGDDAPPSPLQRVIKIMEDVFSQCSSPGCLPAEGMPLLAFEGFDAAAVVRRSRSRALLKQQRSWWQGMP